MAPGSNADRSYEQRGSLLGATPIGTGRNVIGSRSPRALLPGEAPVAPWCDVIAFRSRAVGNQVLSTLLPGVAPVGPWSNAVCSWVCRAAHPVARRSHPVPDAIARSPMRLAPGLLVPSSSSASHFLPVRAVMEPVPMVRAPCCRATGKRADARCMQGTSASHPTPWDKAPGSSVQLPRSRRMLLRLPV
jgi:hypothetical protein